MPTTEEEAWINSSKVLHGNLLTTEVFCDAITTAGWKIGRLTYGHPEILNHLHYRYPYLEIGSFCSIGPSVQMMFGGGHHFNFMTSYPLGAAKPFVGETGRCDFYDDAHAEIRIGHDVWIGRDVLILGGVTIGTGAVIGARAVVAKDVEPYAIVVGNPARKVRMRFTQEEVELLLASECWNLSFEDVERLQPELLSTDVRAFSDAVKSLKSRSGTTGLLHF